MTVSTKLNQELVTVTSNKGEKTMTSKTNPMNYSVSESVRTDGIDLYIDTDALIQYLQIDHNELRRLRERGALWRCNSEECGVQSARIPFPSPTLIKGRNYWKLREVRDWELKHTWLFQLLDDDQIIPQSVNDKVTEKMADIRSKLLTALDDC